MLTEINKHCNHTINSEQRTNSDEGIKPNHPGVACFQNSNILYYYYFLFNSITYVHNKLVGGHQTEHQEFRRCFIIFQFNFYSFNSNFHMNNENLESIERLQFVFLFTICRTWEYLYIRRDVWKYEIMRWFEDMSLISRDICSNHIFE